MNAAHFLPATLNAPDVILIRSSSLKYLQLLLNNCKEPSAQPAQKELANILNTCASFFDVMKNVECGAK